MSFEYMIKRNNVEISQRKKEGLLKLARVIQWGRRHPVDFIHTFMGIQ
jgi:hypothetical protein